MWNKVKELYAGVFLILSLAWILAHLILIKARGKVVITENNKWILKAEIILTGFLIFLGLERLVYDITDNK